MAGLALLLAWSVAVARGGSPRPSAAAAPDDIPPLPENGFTLQAKVAEVETGSRFSLDLAGRRSVVELSAAVSPGIGQECGETAASLTRDLVRGRRVEVAVGSFEGDAARARVLVEGRDLAVELLRAGLAWVRPGCREPGCLEAQEAARAARSGLWGGKSPVPPWEAERGRAPKAIAPGPFGGVALAAAGVVAFGYFLLVAHSVRKRAARQPEPVGKPAPAPEKPLTRLARACLRKKRHSTSQEDT